MSPAQGPLEPVRRHALVILRLPTVFSSVKRVCIRVHPLTNFELSLIIQTLEIKKSRFSED